MTAQKTIIIAETSGSYIYTFLETQVPSVCRHY